MTQVIELPDSLDDITFEQVFERLARVPADAKIIVDARHTRWASPYGLTALLTVAQTRLERPTLSVPEVEDTLTYWSRARFFEYADRLYDLAGRVPRTSRLPAESSVLLEVTPIVQTEDVHSVVGNIQQRASTILQEKLNLPAKTTMRFTMVLSEICQNVLEHAGTGGWVAVQTYKWQRRLGRNVVVIAVCDAGMGFRRSLESSPAHQPDDRWGDRMALEDTVTRGASRHRDPGRGQGLAGVRGILASWNAKLSVRSGTARIAVVPEWDADEVMKEYLAPFPGAQVQITIPERIKDS